MTYSSNRGMLNLLLVFVTGLILFAGCAVLVSGLSDTVDGVLNDQDAARIERLRLLEVEAQHQEAQEAEALAAQAEAQTEIERERAAQEVAKQRQMEYQVEWQRAAGDKAEADANAYTTRRMADAAHAAIQRQGRLLTLSIAQQYVFGGVMALALVAVVVLAVVVLQARKKAE